MSTVVALDEDLPRLRALRDNPRFTRVDTSPPFVVYVSRAAPAPPREIVPGHLRLSGDSACGAWLPARIAYYPLWSAEAGGRPLATRRGEIGDLQVQSPGTGAEIDLVYRRGHAEVVGLALSALSSGLYGVLIVAGYRRRR